jgi:hypothetical protein
LTCGFFAYVMARLDLHSVSVAVKQAVAVWLIGPLPLILTNAAFMTLHRVFVVSYSLGWLIKLTIVAGGGWLVPSLTPTGETIVSFGFVGPPFMSSSSVSVSAAVFRNLQTVIHGF